MLFFIIVILLSATVAVSAWMSLGIEGGFVAGTVIVVAWSIIDRKAHMSMTPMEIFVIVVIILILLGLLCSPAISGRTPEERRIMCVLRLKRLALELRAYHDEFGSFPPAYIADGHGRPRHSWRALMLPYLSDGSNYKELYEEIREKYTFDEPWDSPGNSKLKLAPSIHRHYCGTAYCCPDDPSRWDSASDADAASYFAVVGPWAAWRGAMPVSLDDLPDRGKRIILLAEASDRNVNWKEPKDLTLEDAAAGVNRPDGRGISGGHILGDDYQHHPLRGAYVAFADASVRFLPNDISPEDLEALLTGDTSRQIDLDSLAQPKLNMRHIYGPPVLILSALALFVVVIAKRVNRKA